MTANPSTTAVFLWKDKVGTCTWVDEKNTAIFHYEPSFIKNAAHPSPFVMPFEKSPHHFPTLAYQTFHGLPGLLADSLPDKFGKTILDAWLMSQGQSPERLNSVERLRLIANRGMGALEYEPSFLLPAKKTKEIDIAQSVRLINKVLNRQIETIKPEELNTLFQAGTSAGGARAKMILYWNPPENIFYANQPSGSSQLEHWLLKLDGISNNRDKEQADPQGYGKIEYAYYLMAREAGINMSSCRLHQEGGRCHFMTKRFDRGHNGEKYHMQTLGALVHFDYNQPDQYSYEQVIPVMKALHLPQDDFDQFVLRAMFNMVGRNQDDHVKNISFLLGPSGEWRLSPAYDLTYAYQPFGKWTGHHQMSILGKRDGFTREDLISFAKLAGIKASRAEEMLSHVIKTFRCWPDIADQIEIPEKRMLQIQKNLRFVLSSNESP